MKKICNLMWGFILSLFIVSFFSCSPSDNKTNISITVNLQDLLQKSNLDNNFSRNVSEEEIKLQVTLFDVDNDYSEVMSKEAIFVDDNAFVTFEEVPLFLNVLIKAKITKEDVILYKGESQIFKVHAGKNFISIQLSRIPTDNPSDKPSDNPSDDPSDNPSDDPSDNPTDDPSDKPSDDPSDNPTDNPSDDPSDNPTDDPTNNPTDDPSDKPSDNPSDNPTDDPSDNPSDDPSDNPTDDPSDNPSDNPSDKPTDDPSDNPTDNPSDQPTDEPTDNTVYKITYILDGGINSDENPESYKSGDDSIVLKSATKIGYTFKGWFNQDNQLITKIQTGTSGDITLIAKWIPNTNTVYKVEHWQQNIDNDNYSLVESDTENKTGTTDENTEATAKTYSGFSAKSITQQTIAADGSTVVQIFYDRNIVTLTFDTDSTSEIDAITGKYGAQVLKPENPTKKGYDFDSWNPELPDTFPATNTTYTAHWNPITYSITYVLNADDVKNPNTVKDYTIESKTIELQFPTRAGYSFEGWFDQDNKLVTEILNGSVGDITLSALWKKIEYTLTITTPSYSELKEFEINEIDSTLSVSIPNGYSIEGWYVNGQKIDSPINSDGNIITEDITSNHLGINEGGIYTIMIIVKETNGTKLYSAECQLKVTK